jgi:glycosyltransferase involved in cell wall biosynthesis
MTRIVFYIDSEWAFGQIHYELAKNLYQKNIDASVLPWQQPYTLREMTELAAVTDRFVTNPNGYVTLRRDYGIAPEQIIIIAHAVYDLNYLYNQDGAIAFDAAHQFIVVSEFLRQTAETLGIARRPTVLHLGINTNRYAFNPSTQLRTIGIAGKFHRVDPHTGYDLKRGYLVERCAQALGLEVKIAENYHNSFVTMAGFYPTVDCVIIASTEEGAGLPALEAAAAGRLVISTPVGHWPERAGEKGGITVPIEESAFTEQVIAALKKYQDDPAAFARTCRAIQKHAASYDWSLVADEWAALLSR